MTRRFIKDTDPGFKKIKKLLLQIENTNVKIGWMEEKALKNNRNEAGGRTNAQVAHSIIKGNPLTGQVPRDFLSNVAKIKMKSYHYALETQIIKVIKKFAKNSYIENKRLLNLAFAKIGELAKSDIKIELTDNTDFYAPNEESTIKAWQKKRKSRKGKMKKLFTNTGQMINSVTYFVSNSFKK